jgi:hypothetical protein
MSSFDDIKLEIDDLKVEFTDKPDDELFEYLSLKFLFLDGQLQPLDIRNHYTGGSNDGGVDVFYADDENTLNIVQAKYSHSDGESLSKGTVMGELRQMLETVKNIKANRTQDYNSHLGRIGRREIADTEKIIKFFIVSNRSINDVEGIRQEFDTEAFDEISELEIYDANSLSDKINEVLGISKFVNEGKINIYKEHKHITYGEDGIVVNLKASSLKKLHTDFSDQGLYGYNLRHFISVKKIDDKIKESLESDNRSQFWFKNNGVVIVCSDFRIDGDNIRLYNFSVVNGCQTSSNIARFTGAGEDIDFPILCKIVKSNKQGTAHDDFVAQLAISSNSQKPIQYRDHRSNHIFQEKLYDSLKNLKNYNQKYIHCEIKKGVKFIHKTKDSFKIPNTEVGKLLWDLYQCPGQARSTPGKIWSDEATYKKIFSSAHTKSDLVVDLINLKLLVQKQINKYIKDNKDASNSGVEKYLDIHSNSLHFFIAFICYFLKREHLKDQGINVNNYEDVRGNQYEIKRIFKENIEINNDFNDHLATLLIDICDLIDNTASSERVAFHNITKRDTLYEKFLETAHSSNFTVPLRYKRLKESFDSIFAL